MNPFQAPSRSASGSGMFSGILATRSVDSSQDDDDNNNNASVGRNETHRQSPSRTSSLQESNQSGMINGRGALIGGIAIPKSDDSEEEDDDDNYDATSSMDEIEYTGGGGEDLEHGTDAPDSDCASYAPPSIFQNSKKYQVANKSKRVLGSRSNENKASATAVLSNFPVTIKNHQPPMEGPLESDVSTEELHRSSTDGKQHRPTVWYGLVIISCLLIGAVTAVGILVTRRMDDDATSNMTSRQKELNDIVASLVEPLLLQNPDSAQAKANAWLIYDDTQWMDETVNVTSAMVVQRYVLAVFYFATSGSFWSNSNWLVGHECNSNNNSNNDTWIGVKCSSDGQVRALVFGKS